MRKDLAVRQEFINNIQPTQSVKLKWLEVQIQEKKSQLVGNKQAQEDLVQGQLKILEAAGEMIELELNELKLMKEQLLSGVEVIN